jgi:hypothetical protein
MRVLAELFVDSSLCLANAAETLRLKHPSNSFEIAIENNPKAGPFSKDALRVEMIFETDSLDTAWDDALDNMAVVLNGLARTTGARFDHMTVARAFDWTPGLVEREGRLYGALQARMSFPALDTAFAATTERIMAMHDDEVSQTVMRWYRLGRGADGPEEQFAYLWFAVEIAAGALKETGKIAYKCPKCGTDLYCPACADTPTRRRFETEAIKDLICSVSPPQADHDELFATLMKIRNTLQHGRRFESISDTLPCTQKQALNTLANIAWRAITRLANEDADPTPKERMTFARIEDVPNNMMVMTTAIHVRFEKGDPDHPTLSEAPHVDVSQVIGTKSYTFDGREVEQ